MRCDVADCINLTQGGDQLQVFANMKGTLMIIKIGSFVKLLSSCLLYERECAECWIAYMKRSWNGSDY